MFRIVERINSEAMLAPSTHVRILLWNRLRRSSTLGQTKLKMVGNQIEQSLNSDCANIVVAGNRSTSINRLDHFFVAGGHLLLSDKHLSKKGLAFGIRTAGNTKLKRFATITGQTGLTWILWSGASVTQTATAPSSDRFARANVAPFVGNQFTTLHRISTRILTSENLTDG